MLYEPRQLTGFRVALGLAVYLPDERPAEPTYANGVQLVGEFVVRAGLLRSSARACRHAAITLVMETIGADAEMAESMSVAKGFGRLRATHQAMAGLLGLAVADAETVHEAATLNQW